MTLEKEAAEEAQQQILAAFVEKQMDAHKPSCHLNTKRLDTAEGSTVINAYYLANFNSEDVGAWPKLDFILAWMRFAPNTTTVLAEGYDNPSLQDFPQLDIFRSELPEDAAKWVIGQLKEKPNKDLFAQKDWQGLTEDIKDERIKEFFQHVDDAPRCDECSTFLRNDGPPEYPVFGCPECCEPYCPFCYVALHSDENCCEHIVIEDGSDWFNGHIASEEAAYSAAWDDYFIKKSEFMDGIDWSVDQKKAALGTLLPSYEIDGWRHFESSGFVSFLEALPLSNGMKTVSFSWEDGRCMSSSGFFCNKPEIAIPYYQEQIAKLITGLDTLMEMEPEGSVAD